MIREAIMKLAKKETVTNILFDIKSVDDDIHRAYTGVSNALILEKARTVLCSFDEEEKGKTYYFMF